MRIAVDAMGGDNAPAEVVSGALAARESLGGDELVLFGDEAVVLELLGDPAEWSSWISVEHAPDIVTMDEAPVEALRRKRNSSIALMAKAAAAGKVDVVISAGNTGACVAVFQMRMRLLAGVQRPGILVVFPMFGGPVAVCDVGANIAPKPGHLHQYALMASIYSREVVGVANPTVGLVSIGQEDAKGNELVKKTNRLLREDDRIDFVGNVETRELLNRPADVVVCDGFVGNVILKLTEGLAEGLFKAIGRDIARYAPEMVKHFQPIVDQLYAQHDYNEYGGAPLLGVAGTCIICHGSSDSRAIKNAIVRAQQLARSGVNRLIVAELNGVPAARRG